MLATNNKGQILLIVVLAMILVLTIGLSVASRTISNLKITRDSDESERAFQAAEAGVEQIIQSSKVCADGAICSTSTLSNNSNFSTKLYTPGNKAFQLNGEEVVDQDTGIDVWLSDYPSMTQNKMTGLITIYWGTPNQVTCNLNAGPGTRSALEVSILYGSEATPQLKKYFYEAVNCPSSRVAGVLTSDTTANLTTPVGTSIQFQNKVQIPLTNGLIMKVIPIFNSSKIYVTSDTVGVNFPAQGKIIESTGKSGDTVRKIKYFSSYPQIPVELFPYSLITQ